MRNLLIVACLAFVSVDAAAAQLDGTPPDTAPRFAFAVDPVTELVGIPRLRDPGALGTADREVRLWVGFGIGAPHRLLRVVDRMEGAHGQLVLWWSGTAPRGIFHGTPEAEQEWRDRTRSFAEGMRSRMHELGCTRLHQSPLREACEFVFEEAPDWDRLLDEIDKIDPWTLPDPRTLDPPPGIGIDGITIMVEVRTRESYRTYAYWTPQRQLERPEYARAYALMRLMPGRIGAGPASPD